jgi:putative flippase GtrA
MTKKLKKLYKKYREVIVYILLGGVATLINWVSAYLLKLFLDEQIVWQNVVINTVAWIAANAFAYPALRKWVFKSKNKHILKECLEFFSSRIITWVLEIALMALTVNALHMNFWLSKVLVGLVIVVANYAVSKLIVFRKKRRKKKKPETAEPVQKAEAGQ